MPSVSTSDDDWYEAAALRGDRVTLAPLRQEHATGSWPADHDDVFRWLRYARPTTRTEAQALVDLHLAGAAARQAVPWAQVSTETGEVAGLTTYYDIDPATRSVAIGGT